MDTEYRVTRPRVLYPKLLNEFELNLLFEVYTKPCPVNCVNHKIEEPFLLVANVFQRHQTVYVYEVTDKLQCHLRKYSKHFYTLVFMRLLNGVIILKEHKIHKY